MADDKQACMTCSSSCGGKSFVTFKEGAWANNPIAIQMLGICSALAVTSRLENSLVMGVALLFVCVGSNLIVSILRNNIPHRIRMVTEVAIIATFVILFDIFLKAYYFEMSQQLGPYVALIVTNCIVMGRAEAFALQNPPLLSIIDGVANGVGYGVVLAVIGFTREVLGTGGIQLFGKQMTILAESWYTPNLLMVLAPGAFFVLGIVIGVFNAIKGPAPEEGK